MIHLASKSVAHMTWHDFWTTAYLAAQNIIAKSMWEKLNYMVLWLVASICKSDSNRSYWSESGGME